MQLQSRKAQIAVTDFFIALFILGILVSFIILSWNTQELRFNEALEYEDMMVKAFQVSDVLVGTQGYPLNWNSTNVDVIGLAESDRIISNDKLTRFSNITDAGVKSAFSLAPYNFEFVLEKADGTELFSKGSSFNGNKAVNAERIVLYQENEAIVKFTLWK